MVEKRWDGERIREQTVVPKMSKNVLFDFGYTEQFYNSFEPKQNAGSKKMYSLLIRKIVRKKIATAKDL